MRPFVVHRLPTTSLIITQAFGKVKHKNPILAFSSKEVIRSGQPKDRLKHSIVKVQEVMPSAGGFRKSNPYAALLTSIRFHRVSSASPVGRSLRRAKASSIVGNPPLQFISSVSATALSPFRFTQMFVFPKRASCHRAGSVTGGFFFPFVTIGSEQLLTFRKWPPAFSAHPRRWSCRQREYGPAERLPDR